MCQLFYVSNASRPYEDAVIQDILQTSRRNNRRSDVTGCLLFSGLHFAQVLEGAEAVVAPLARRIAGDPRHANVTVLRESHRPEREYGDWSMAYLHDLGLEDRLEQFMRSPEHDQRDIAEVMARMKPDTVMGALR
ncbi:MAG: BLUF domain-containing protein [Caldimonas sp.]